MPAGVQHGEAGGATLAAALAEARARLAGAGIGTAALDARLLVGAATGLEHEQMIRDPDRPVTARERGTIEAMVARRLAREPVSRILGEREFWGRRFAVSPATLDPRPDSETLVEAAVDWLRRNNAENPVVADLGTGSGCLLVSVLAEVESAWGIGIDVDPAALETARANAERHLAPGRACFLCGDWLAPIGTRLGAIIANPPYIPTEEIDHLAPEVARCDPRRALDGGRDGLDAFRQIIDAAARHLIPGGLLAFEIGDGQMAAVSALMEKGGFAVAEARPDLSGTVRCICATLVA